MLGASGWVAGQLRGLFTPSISSTLYLTLLSPLPPKHTRWVPSRLQAVQPEQSRTEWAGRRCGLPLRQPGPAWLPVHTHILGLFARPRLPLACPGF